MSNVYAFTYLYHLTAQDILVTYEFNFFKGFYLVCQFQCQVLLFIVKINHRSTYTILINLNVV